MWPNTVLRIVQLDCTGSSNHSHTKLIWILKQTHFVHQNTQKVVSHKSRIYSEVLSHKYGTELLRSHSSLFPGVGMPERFVPPFLDLTVKLFMPVRNSQQIVSTRMCVCVCVCIPNNTIHCTVYLLSFSQFSLFARMTYFLGKLETVKHHITVSSLFVTSMILTDSLNVHNVQSFTLSTNLISYHPQHSSIDTQCKGKSTKMD